MVKFGLGCFFIVQLQTQVTASQNEKNKTKKKNITFLYSAVVCIQFKNWYGVYVTLNIWVVGQSLREEDREGGKERERAKRNR